MFPKIICPVCGLEATQSGRCEMAEHWKCPYGHEMCGYERFWRRDGQVYCGECGAEMRYAQPGQYNGQFVSGWICPVCDPRRYLAVLTPKELYERLDALDAHRRTYGRGRTEGAAYVRNFCKAERKRIRDELRARDKPTTRPGDTRVYGPSQFCKWQRAGG